MRAHAVCQWLSQDESHFKMQTKGDPRNVLLRPQSN